MSIAMRQPMTRDAFFDWADTQEGRYEFDGFQPVAMTGGELGHSVLIGNILRHLGSRLTGKPCRPLGPYAGVATIGQSVRYPDAVVTCSPFNNRDRLVPNPVLVFEVVSPTSVRTDRVVKLREYQAVPSIRRYIIVEPDAAAVTVLWRESPDDLFKTIGLTQGDILSLPEIDIEIPIEAIYEGLIFNRKSNDQTI
jgi:Uma2 family endonuclease